MTDLIVDHAVLSGVARTVRRAGAEFGSEPALAWVDRSAFGSETVASAFKRAAVVHDRGLASLEDDAATLGSWVDEAGAAFAAADSSLTREASSSADRAGGSLAAVGGSSAGAGG